ncbi:glycosyltransferase [Mycolicibacterium tokaiense]|uniref:Glycosyl transferase family protein n=1 Tax=Mycolicibacterium tokaiense TaxID=39695 RepID=A0A378T7G7_9MYCO|nr:glycosyltransferase [Mycolicibacterium tokaiense]BBY88704.1 hypothetical protein MTOK_44860 [Mycolicibacterium tokaiense]STZ56771.1 glycosyl transferase family protein [Mycolicibacterium tokaiense]
MTEKSIEVIIPVRNLAGQIPELARPLLEQRHEGDVITVINDASTDDTAEVAAGLGLNVITLTASHGPYFARQTAARRSTADILLFIDGRCRPLPGLLDAHREMQSRDGVALSCTDVRTRTGPSLAARVAELQQPFSLRGRVDIPGRPPYFPTCNLGIARPAFEAVNGFRVMRGGGDVDICWRIQEQQLGEMAVDHRVLMEWEPRTSMRDLASQYRRYGRSTAYLKWAFGDQSPAVYRKDSLVEAVKGEIARRKAIRWPTVTEELARISIDTVFQFGYLEAKRKRDTFEPPRNYGAEVR